MQWEEGKSMRGGIMLGSGGDIAAKDAVACGTWPGSIKIYWPCNLTGHYLDLLAPCAAIGIAADLCRI